MDFATNHSIEELGFSKKIGVEYSMTPSYDLDFILKKLNIESNDNILDFGAGKGAAIATMSKYPFTRIGGVEISSTLTEIANKNLSKLKIKNARVYCSDAKDYFDLDIYNYFYLFNPFPTIVLKKVFQNLKDSYYRCPREMCIIYYNPGNKGSISSYIFKKFDNYMGRYFNVELYKYPLILVLACSSYIYSSII